MLARKAHGRQDNPEHFKAFFDREGKAFAEKIQQRLELGKRPSCSAKLRNQKKKKETGGQSWIAAAGRVATVVDGAANLDKPDCAKWRRSASLGSLTDASRENCRGTRDKIKSWMAAGVMTAMTAGVGDRR